MIIPNSVINKAIVENSNYNNDYIGNYMEISVSYESNLEQAIEVMRETIEMCIRDRFSPEASVKVSSRMFSALKGKETFIHGAFA